MENMEVPKSLCATAVDCSSKTTKDDMADGFRFTHDAAASFYTPSNVQNEDQLSLIVRQRSMSPFYSLLFASKKQRCCTRRRGMKSTSWLSPLSMVQIMLVFLMTAFADGTLNGMCFPLPCAI
jgi:hypothetical protein